jgi:aldose 1-epimerase
MPGFIKPRTDGPWSGTLALVGTAVLATWSGAVHAEEVRVTPYGLTRDGLAVTAYTLINDAGSSATVLDFGGTVVEIRVPDRAGQLGNVVMSFADLTGWETVGHANAIIGRFANRIRGGVTIDDVHYPLQQNALGVTLHGGPPPFSTRQWKAEPIGPEDGAAVTLTLDSPAGDQGFPGALTVRATYRLSEDNALSLTFEATTDAATEVNLTNHVYFNLNGNSTISVYDHRFQLMADRIAVKDAASIPTGELRPVAGTAFDLSTGAPLMTLVAAAGDPDFAEPRPDAPALPPGQLRNFDHSYVFTDGDDRLDAVVARLEDDVSGRVLEVRTTEPSAQIYIPGSARSGVLSDIGQPFVMGPAIAIETQHLPDTPNKPHFGSTRLRPGEVFRSTTVWAFKTLD